MLDEALRDLIRDIRSGKTAFLEKQFQKVKADYVKAKEPKLTDKGLIDELFVVVCQMSPLNDDVILLATNILYVSKGITITNMGDLVSFYENDLFQAYHSIVSDTEVWEWIKIALFRSCTNDLLPSMQLLNELRDFCIALSGGELINLVKRFRFTSRVVEGITKVFQSNSPSQEMELESWFIGWIQENLYSSDDLLLHKNKDLIVCLLIQHESCRSSILEVIWNLESSLKVKYQIITELITRLRKVLFETGSSPFFLEIPNTFLTDAKEAILVHLGLRPAISDTFVAMISAPGDCISCQPSLLDFIFDKEINSKVAKYLIPRLLKSHPESVKRLAKTYKVTNEESLEVYIQIVMSICEMDGSDLNSCLEKDILKAALSHSQDDIRLGMFGCLCKSFGVNRKISFDFLFLIKTFIWHLFLESSSDLRQKSLNFFQVLLTSLFARLYALIRDEGKAMAYSGESVAESMASLQLTDEKEMLVKWMHDLIDLLFIGMASEENHRFGSVEFGVRALMEIETAVQLRNRSKTLRELSKSDQILDKYIADFMQRIQEKGKTVFVKIAFDNVFTSNRTFAAEALAKFNVLDGAEDEIGKEALKRLKHPRECLSEGAATVLTVLQEAKRINMKQEAYEYERFVQIFEGQLILTKEKLAFAASEDNLNGTLCLLTKLIRQQRVKNAEAEIDKKIAQRIISLCQEVCSVVSAIASQPSPEGSDLGQFFDNTGTIPMTETSRLILTFCWRAIKEATNLMGEMIGLRFYTDQEGIRSVLDFLVDLILCLRHPGAFTALESPINMICKVLISSGSDYAEQLLSASIDDCLHHPEIQTTRRSAGLPLCINAILTAYPKADLRPLTMVMKAMFEVLTDYDLAVLNPSPSIVHALNIIKSIFRDADLAEQCATFVGESFRLCFRSFKSASWAVRNGAMMLFGALVRRSFGSKEASLVDARTIAQSYPGLLSCFEDELRSVGQATDESKDKFIYPLLSILQRMKFSSGAITSFQSFFSSTVTFIFDSCIPSKSMKIRRIASRIVTESLWLPCPEIVWPILKERCLGKNLISKSCNELHGKLLVINEALKHDRTLLSDEDLSVLKVYYSASKVPSVIRYLALVILNRCNGFAPSEADVLAGIKAVDGLEPYQFELISSMMQLSGLQNPQAIAEAIMKIRFEGLRFSLMAVLMETTTIPPDASSSLYKAPRQGENEASQRTLPKHHFGYELAKLKQLKNPDELFYALQRWPRNPDVVRSVLNAAEVLADSNRLLEAVEGFFDPSQQHTDLVRLIAAEALGRVVNLQPSFRLLKLTRTALTDDDEDVRHAACVSFAALFKLSPSELSVAAALTQLHQLMRRNYAGEYQAWAASLIPRNSIPKEDSGILFLKEEENMFVNPHWELASFTQ